MNKLLNGIRHFRSRVVRPRHQFFRRLALGQQPETLFITCSDSRIDPNLLTQTGLGELFVLRNAGNIVPAHGTNPGGEAATIEFAVSQLGIKDIVVCGHSHCGAMTGLLAPEALAGLPAVSAWLAHAEPTRRIVEEAYGHLREESRLEAAIRENVLVQLENLRTYPVVAERLARGDLRLHGWVYQIEDGQVFVHDPDARRFVPVPEDSAVGGPRPQAARTPSFGIG
ncbi:MAG TPA: carbonic anhydrase [Isosphaeraceae bacterium]|jgi:carbonic anhydrase